MARKARGIYLPLDIEFFDNDRILAVGEKPAWLYLAMCCRAKRLLSDGVLSEHQIQRLSIRAWEGRLKRLIEAGLVLRTDDDRYLIVGWLERNLSANDVEAVRDRDRNRKQNPRNDRLNGPLSERNPDGIQSDPKRREEKRREEEGEVDVTSPRSHAATPLRVIA